MVFLGSTCYTPSPFTSSDVIWSLRETGTVYSTTYLVNYTVSNRPCFFRDILGERSAFRLSNSLQQYFTVNYYIDLRNASFSITAWIYFNSIDSLMHIFAQCNTTQQQKCLFAQIDDGELHFGFLDSDAQAGTNLEINRWYHVTFIFNNSSSGSQVIYLNGIEDGKKNVRRCRGAPANFTIGWRDILNPGYFDGLIDRISIHKRIMTAAEVLEEATLSAYYSFNNSIEEDSGPNEISGFGNNLLRAQGISGLGLGFPQSSTGSYFQTGGFLLLAVTPYSYSFSFWTRLNQSQSGGSIIHLTTENGWCLSLLGFNENGSLIAQSWDGNIQVIVGAPLQNNWTHIGLTYDFGGELNLYQNGTLSGSIESFTSTINASAVTVTLGYTPSQADCATESIVPAPFVGIIDEFRIYSRCLSTTEIRAIIRLI